MTVAKLTQALLELDEGLHECEVIFFDGSYAGYMEIKGVKILQCGDIEIIGKLAVA